MKQVILGCNAEGLCVQVIGVDYAADMLEDAKRREDQRLFRMKLQNLSRQQQGDRSVRRFAPSMRWVEADAMALPLGDAEINAATLGYGLRNVADIPQVVGFLSAAQSSCPH